MTAEPDTSAAPPPLQQPQRRPRRPTRRSGRLAGWLIRSLIWGLSRLPLSAARRLLGGFAAVNWWLRGRSRTVTLANLRHCHPDLSAREQQQLGRAAARQTAWLLAEQGAVWYWPRARWTSLIDDAAARGQLHSVSPDTDDGEPGSGTLLLVPHLGNWELLSLYLGEFGITALYDPPRLISLDAPIRRARERNGARLLPIDRSGLKGLLQALDDGGMVGLLPDQVPEPNAGVYAPFYQQPALTMTLAHRLIQRARPAVLIGALLRTDNGFELVVRPLPEQIADPDPAVSAAAMNAAIEALVDRAPEQYQWSYKRFKRPPPGAPKLY